MINSIYGPIYFKKIKKDLFMGEGVWWLCFKYDLPIVSVGRENPFLTLITIKHISMPTSPLHFLTPQYHFGAEITSMNVINRKSLGTIWTFEKKNNVHTERWKKSTYHAFFCLLIFQIQNFDKDDQHMECVTNKMIIPIFKGRRFQKYWTKYYNANLSNLDCGLAHFKY